MSKIDLTGKKFERLTVLREGARHTKKGGQSTRTWDCKCICGKDTNVIQYKLTSGRTRSCGCLARDETIERNTAHGRSRTGLYYVWRNLRNRCDREADPRFHRYGARGVEYPSKWEAFEGFCSDMASSYREGLTLDRIDNNLGYSKENCRWIENVFQARNRGKRKDNSSGFTGVSYNKGSDSWLAYCTLLDGRRSTKSFPVKRFGYEAAKGMAMKHRAKMIDDLNKQGANYGNSHGED